MNDDHLHAFPAPAAPAATRPRRRLWPWVLLALLVLMTALTVLAIVGAASTLSQFGTDSITLDIDGDTLELPAMHGSAIVAALVAATGGMAVALLVSLVVVPLVLLGVFGAVALAFTLALLAVLAVAAVVLSPLLLGVALLWWALRPARKARAAAAPASSSA